MTLFVRVKNVNLTNFKNVGYGSIYFDGESTLNRDGTLTGIYGQNGSGKTALLSAVNLVKTLISGESLPKDSHNFIRKGNLDTKIEIEFYLEYKFNEYQIFYETIFGYDSIGEYDDENRDVSILEEKLSYRYKNQNNNNWENLKTLLHLNKEKLSPNYRYAEINKLFEKDFEFPFLIRDSYRDRKSLIFSNELIEITQKNISSLGDEYNLISMLKYYAEINLFVIENRQIGLNYANIFLPLNIRHSEADGTTYGVIMLPLETSNELDYKQFKYIENLFNSINKIICELIPGLEISVKKINEKLDKDNELKIIFELMSVRDGYEIPIRYESDGIKKLISIINLLTATYNNRSMSLFIDELDSGIFEYLLGEILLNYQDYGEGQLVFTSHNLRPLELLDKDNLYFTTTNPNNRYVKFKNIKNNNNLRDTYFRNILLGGQDEELYKPTKTSRIRRAFRLASEVINE